MKNSLRISNIINLVFGLFVVSIGLMNTIRGNDSGLGITFIISILFFPVTDSLLQDLFGISIPYYFKFILAFLLIWITLAVGTIAEGYYPEIVSGV